MKTLKNDILFFVAGVLSVLVLTAFSLGILWLIIYIIKNIIILV